MKKFASLLLALVMCLCCLTTAALAERAPVAKDDLKIGFIFLHDENSTYDLNFITAAKAACEKLGIAYETKTNIRLARRRTPRTCPTTTTLSRPSMKAAIWRALRLV